MLEAAYCESPLALSVHADLLADHFLVDTGAEVLFEAVGEGDHHLGRGAVFNNLGPQALSIAAFVVPKEIADHVHR